MSATKVADIIEPSVFLPYVRNATKELSVVFRSGIMQTNPELDTIAKGAGRTYNFPFFNDLSGDAELLSDTVPLTVDNIDADQHVAVKQGWGKAWGANDLAGEIAGADPMAAIGNRVAAYWARWFQKVLVAMIKALFIDAGTDGPLRATHLRKIAVESIAAQGVGTKFNASDTVLTQALLGDAMFDVVGMLVHSSTYVQMIQQNLIEFVPTSIQDVKIPTYLGKMVMMDDAVPKRAGTTDGVVYTTLFFGRGVFGFGEGAPKHPVETDRDILQGDDVLAMRREYIMHPQGLSWDGTFAGKFPSLAELSDPTAWDKVLEDKQIPILALEHN